MCGKIATLLPARRSVTFYWKKFLLETFGKELFLLFFLGGITPNPLNAKPLQTLSLTVLFWRAFIILPKEEEKGCDLYSALFYAGKTNALGEN